MSEHETTDTPQPLVAHLTELRTRLLHSVLVVLLIFLALFYFSSDIYALVSEPLRAVLPEGSNMIATGVVSPFFTPFKLTLVVSIFVAMPYLLFQLWSFIAPGLYRNEKRIALPMLFSSVVLFYAGIAFAYYVVFPLIFGFFSGLPLTGVAYTPDIADYLDIALKLFFAFGLAFEIPIAIVLLISTGITTPQALAAKRPYIIVGCFIIGMLLTPPDVISQSLLAGPMWLLFEIGLLVGRLIRRKSDSDTETDPT